MPGVLDTQHRKFKHYFVCDKGFVNKYFVYPCSEALAMAIQEATGQTLGTTTLKRMLGFVKGPANPRPSSLDIIAQYLVYPDYNLMAKVYLLQ